MARLEMEPILDLGETAGRLGLTREKVRQLVFADLLPQCGQMSRYLFWQSDVDRVAQRLENIDLELDAKREALGL